MKGVFWIVVTPVILICSLAQAGEFKGTGYKLNCPDGWTVAGKDFIAARENFANTLAKGQPTKAHVDAVFSSSDEPDPQARIGVNIAPGSPIIDELHLPKLLEAMFKVSAAAGLKTEVLDSRILAINGRNFVLARANVTGPLFPHPVRTWNLMGTADGKMYMFNFGTPVATADKWEPVFARAVQSVSLESPPANPAGGVSETGTQQNGISRSKGIGWFLELPVALKGLLIAGVIGGLILVLSRFRKRPTMPRTSAPPEPET